MKNLVQAPADIVTVTAPTGGLAAGAVVVLVSGASGRCAVVVNDIAAGETGPAYIKNAITNHAATAGTGLTFAAWDLLYWDSSAKKLTKTATGNTRFGRASKAKGATETTADALLGEF